MEVFLLVSVVCWLQNTFMCNSEKEYKKQVKYKYTDRMDLLRHLTMISQWFSYWLVYFIKTPIKSICTCSLDVYFPFYKINMLVISSHFIIPYIINNKGFTLLIFFKKWKLNFKHTFLKLMIIMIITTYMYKVKTLTTWDQYQNG